MGWRGTTILLLLIAVTGAYLYFDETPVSEPGWADALTGKARAPAPSKTVVPLLEFPPAAVTGLRLERQNDSRETERRDGGWQGATNAAVIDDFLRTLTELGVLAEIPVASPDFTDYGLQPPRGVLRLHLRGRSAPLVIQIGEHNPAATGVYVRLGENGQVVLAGALVAWEFEKAFKALAAQAPTP
jgi:hypothetical protein